MVYRRTLCASLGRWLRGRTLETIIPACGWLKRYRLNDLSRDIPSGLIVAVMLIPQGMAYALLAGLPAIFGLYASTVPAIVYAAFGTSRHMPVGPPAIMALLTFAGVSQLAPPQSDEYVALALLLAVMAGVLQLSLGVLRLGFLTNLVPRPVLTGFIHASAVVIAASQLEHLLGIDISGRYSTVGTVTQLGKHVDEANVVTVVIGIGSISALFLLAKTVPRLPGPLLVAVGTTLVVYLLDLENQGVSVVGDVPRGVPSFTLPPLDPDLLAALLPSALAVAFVGYIESFSVAKAVATKEKYKIDANQEFNALGLANISAGLFSGFPVAGSFSRTAVNYQSGARTQLAPVVTALAIIISLLFLTPLLYYIPKAVLGAIIVVAVYRLIDFDEPRRMFRIRRADGLVFLITFAVTLFVGIEEGVLFGALFGLLAFIRRTIHPDVAELGYVPEQDAFLGMRSYSTARTHPDILIVRFDAPLYYANVSFLEQWLIKTVPEKPELKYIIMDCRGTSSVDATALDELEELITEYRTHNIEVLFTHAKLPIRNRLLSAGWDDKFGADIMSYSTTREVLSYLDLLKTLRSGDE